ncbi:hypothetical protein BGZ61DRAFT_527333 [Ilyonectria robusta]|uniref:uncharacterized protein n=1 Tax=Ilyonectria robusta TaxID=1079257 RepID=UPI001E8EF453|nr:uncharacterized protein BGZ61DRAFT_527333 [Ilyonectria robusta]KAH8736376.1 hypothetical protein BGZ61DRAFT_527333 [Ilyonectria robusta]
MSVVWPKVIRSQSAIQLAIRGAVPAAQRGFHVSRSVRVSATGPTPDPLDTQRNNRNLAIGAGVVGLGVVWFYMSGKPKAKDVPPVA